MSAYLDREQTQAKHFILRGYLQELTFKVLHHWDIAYIDGSVSEFEANLVWRVADLMGVSTRQRVELRRAIAVGRGEDPVSFADTATSTAR